jgi:hypothetical protein
MIKPSLVHVFKHIILLHIAHPIPQISVFRTLFLESFTFLFIMGVSLSIYRTVDLAAGGTVYNAVSPYTLDFGSVPIECSTFPSLGLPNFDVAALWGTVTQDTSNDADKPNFCCKLFSVLIVRAINSFAAVTVYPSATCEPDGSVALRDNDVLVAGSNITSIGSFSMDLCE